MIDLSYLQELIAQLPDWVTGTEFLVGILQVVAYFLALLFAGLLKRLFDRLLDKLDALLPQVAILQEISWLPTILKVLRSGLYPFSAWVLGQIAIALFDNLGLSYAILDWAVPFFSLWLIYRFGRTVIDLRFPPDKAHIWGHQVLRPLIIILAILHAIGFLRRFLQTSFRISNSPITFGALFTGLITFYFFFAMSKGSRRFLGQTVLPKAGVDRSLTEIVSTMSSYVIIVVGFMLSLSIIGIPLTTLTVIAGGLSVGIGFGLQELISNFISGFILMFERSISPGDIIKVEDTFAIVDNVGIRSMQIRDIDNMTLIVPNNYFLSRITTNLTRNELKLRWRIPVTVNYQAVPREVEEALLAAAKPYLGKIMIDPEPSVQFRDFTENGMEFNLVVWIDDLQYFEQVLSGLRYNIWEEMNRRQIGFAIPPRSIQIESMPNGSNEL